MHYYLSIGSNLGNRLAFLQFACDQLKLHATIEKVSSIYETEAIGFETDNLFLNACLLVNCTHAPQELLGIIHQIENLAGRKRMNDGVYHSRPLDIDIIFCDSILLKSDNLTIPHAKFSERKFVLIPLNDLSEKLIDPLSKIPIQTLIEKSQDNSHVKRQHFMLFI